MAPSAEPPEQSGDDRKGLRRQRLLLEGALRLIEREGAAAVGREAVAEEVGLSPDAVAHYFPTTDDLLSTTLTACNDSYIRYLGDTPQDGRSLEHLAHLIAESAAGYRPHLAARHELFLMAARRSDMRAEMRRWTRALDDFLARFLDDPVERAGVAAAVDGLFLRSLCTEERPDPEEILAVLHRLTRQEP